jgi:clan AA aspartic protease
MPAMTGMVDGSGRALLKIRLRHPISNVETDLDAWVDTGFTGELVVPQTQITAFGLPLGPPIRARLADGSQVELETYLCLIEWFGTWRQIEIIANTGQHPLLGVGLLLGHELHIDYRTQAMTLL